MTEFQRKQATGAPPGSEATRTGRTFTPQIDIVESEHELVLFADLPGVASENLDIDYEDGQLTLVGKVPPRHPGVEFRHAEYAVGDFRRTFTIGESIDAGQISAELKNGVLIVHLPKVQKLRPRKIQVSGE